jgi:tetratricopeptide (TPR) repeat protein
MAFETVLAQVLELLQRQGWASYRTLRRRFGLDEAALAALTQALTETQPVTMDATGTRLLWQGELRPAATPTRTWAGGPSAASPPPPAALSVTGAALPPLGGARQRRVSPLVGREQEVALLRARWAQVQAGQGQVVALSGEAGIGKSRLVQVVTAHVASVSHRWWACRGAPTAQYSAFAPVMDLLQQMFQDQPDDPPTTKLHKLETALAVSALPLPDAVPLLAALLTVPLGDRYPPLTSTPEQQRQRTLETVLMVLQGLAAPQPGLLIVEDLHWVDPSTLELLSRLVAQAATARLYVLLTWRPEFQLPWPPSPHQTTLTLGRLLPPQVEALATQVAGGKTLPPAVLAQIVARSEGVPLMVEELTRIVLESGLLREEAERYALTGALPPLAVPPTVHDSIVVRLERLGEAQVVAQVGAVWGRGFTEAQIQAVAPLDRRRLEQALGRLVAADMLQEVSLPPRVTYIFKHVLIQEAAYASMPPELRRQSHQRIAQVLVEQFPGTAETQPELLAYHYTEARCSAQAIPYWQRAGQRAIERSANLEAIEHFTKGLEVLKALPHTPERLQQELRLQTALSSALMVTRGFAAPEVEQAYTRAYELCQRVEVTPQLFLVLGGLQRFYLVRGALQTARELAEQAFTLAQRLDDQGHFLRAHHELGSALFLQGEVAAAHAYCTQGMAFYQVQRQQLSPSHTPVHDAGVGCCSYAAWCLWVLGYPAQALQQSHETLTLAQELSRPYYLAHALYFAALVHQFRREAPLTQERAEAAMALCAEQGYAYYLALVTVLRGWALAAQGQDEAGLAQLRQGLAAVQGDGGSTDVSCGPAGRKVLARGAGHRGAAPAGRDTGGGRQKWGTLVGGRAVPAPGGVAATAGCP